jgi:uncharacterized protein
LSLDEYLLQGFFPRIYKDKLNATKYYRNYVQTYLERDVRQLIRIYTITVIVIIMRLMLFLKRLIIWYQ